MSANQCTLNGLKGTIIDPYSKKGKNKLNKANCIVSSIFTEDGTVFFIGNDVSKEVMLAQGYFTLEKEFDETKSTWKSTFSQIKNFQSEKVLLTGSGGPKRNGLVITPEKGILISRALEKIKILNESL